MTNWNVPDEDKSIAASMFFFAITATGHLSGNLIRMTGHNPVLAVWLSVTRGFPGLVQVLHSSDQLKRTGEPLLIYYKLQFTGTTLTREPC